MDFLRYKFELLMRYDLRLSVSTEMERGCRGLLGEDEGSIWEIRDFAASGVDVYRWSQWSYNIVLLS